jgi:hypothetical protein
VISVSLKNKSPDEIMIIVRSMRKMGWVQGIDFDFAFNQSKWDEMIGEIPKYTVFTFYQEKYATWFSLRWA